MVLAWDHEPGWQVVCNDRLKRRAELGRVSFVIENDVATVISLRGQRRLVQGGERMASELLETLPLRFSLLRRHGLVWELHTHQ